MHELSITRSLLGLVLEKSGQRRTRSIHLVIGELSGVLDDCLRLYFELLSEGTLAEGAELRIRRESPRFHCRDCQHQWPGRSLPGGCPGCGSESIQMGGGTALFIESIEVEDEDTCC